MWLQPICFGQNEQNTYGRMKTLHLSHAEEIANGKYTLAGNLVYQFNEVCITGLSSLNLQILNTAEPTGRPENAYQASQAN